ncbi:TPX2, C-terminal [Sesbania bispinosa]|nr:TPX2, C-terminal [Sesbania bispinosa]
MGDSACLMQPFCYASGISNEANESNPIHALGQSISFGRFMSESLAWEKWSSFSHNRYVEEAERYSRPGSVAQKKAFFEAHYKKLAAQKAAALLEQANNAAQNNATGQEDGEVIDNDTHDSQTSPNHEMVVKEEKDAKVLSLTSEPDTMVSATSQDLDSNIEASIVSESSKIEEAEPEMGQAAVIENSMEVGLQNQLEDVDAHKEQSETPPIMTPLVKLLQQVPNSDQEVLASTGKKKPPASSFKLLKANGTSKVTSTPVKSTAPISSKRDNIATPMSSKPAALSTAEKKRSTPKSLQMSVNFTPIRELNRLTASVMRRFESTRVGPGSSKASKDSLTPLRTPTMASKDMQKHSTLTPLTEKKRNKTPIDSSAAGNRTAGSKWRLLSGENKMRSPIISSPFSLRTEERAARRKKKLEEKFNANEAQKVQQPTKLKEKSETEIIRKLRQSFCFKARPLPDFYKERKASQNETRKDPVTHSESPKEGRKPNPSLAENKTSLPPNRPSVKNNGIKNFHGKSGRTLTHPLTSNSMMIITTHENTSPNIQHGNQHDRNYKK